MWGSKEVVVPVGSLFRFGISKNDARLLFLREWNYFAGRLTRL
jgi:hypothetical protein